MATADSVKANIQNIIAKANSTTGRTDNNVDSAVDALIAGFGTGSGGITPTGTKTITENGTHDVTEYATAVVNVPSPAQKTVVRTVTLSADITGANATTKLLTNDDFIKEHYADEGFSATLVPATPLVGAANVICFNYQGNRNVGTAGKVQYGVGLRASSTSAVGLVGHNTAIKGKGYAQHMRVDSSGNLLQYLNRGYILKAGTYQIILTCTT